MARRVVGLGVIGLGRRWGRYRLALSGLRRTLAVRAVYDPSAARTEQEAHDLGCARAGGVLDLVSRPEVEGVLVLDPSWQGLWPVEQAVSVGKPVLCASSLAREQIPALESAARGMVQVALALRLDALVERLRDLLDERLGPVRFVHVRWTTVLDEGHDILEAPALVPLLHAVATLLEAEPPGVRVVRAAADPGFAGLVLEFGAGGLAHFSCRGSPWAWPSCRVEVEGISGGAEGILPGGEVRWWTDEGEQRLRPARELPERLALAHFAEVVRAGAQPTPSLAEMVRVLGWLRQARGG
jgi:predicted dehydrogenase